MIDTLIKLTSMKTKYSNKYPYNVGYVYSDGSRSFDCVNLVKVLLNDYDINNNTAGYKVNPKPDVTEYGLLSRCSNISSDFSALQPGELLYMSGHVGVYVGEFEAFNVVECTTSFGGGVVTSYVDASGKRYSKKGSRASKKWTSHGMLPYEDVKSVKIFIPTLRYGMRSEQVRILQGNLNASYIGMQIETDSIFGKYTRAAVRRFQSQYKIGVDGIAGPETQRKMKEVLNGNT